MLGRWSDYTITAINPGPYLSRDTMTFRRESSAQFYWGQRASHHIVLIEVASLLKEGGAQHRPPILSQALGRR